MSYVKAAYFYARHNLVTILKRLPAGEKAIVFVELGDDLDEMEKIFGNTAAYYCSPFNERYRKKYSDLSVCVKDGRQLKDILFTTKAMGVGIGLKDRGVKHIFIDQWNPLEIAQSLGRKRSLDADDTCTVYFRIIVLTGTGAQTVVEKVSQHAIEQVFASAGVHGGGRRI